MQNAPSNPDNAGAGATDYMHLFGLVVMGYMWARMAAAAQRKLAAGADGAARRLDAKLVTARFFMDRMLPGNIDGLGIIAALRKSGNRTPILILSALNDVDERIRGLRSGGDDYLTKPFAFGELLARVDALGRRSVEGGAERVLQVGDLHMDLLSRRVTRGSRTVTLQPREFKLLEYLMRHANQVVTRTMLLEAVWDYNFDPQTNVVDVHISKLRQKLELDAERPLLRTVRNAGYMMCEHD